MKVTACAPPSVLTDFIAHFDDGPKATLFDLAVLPSPEVCDARLTGQDAINCLSFSNWTHLIAGYAQVLGAVANLVAKYVTNVRISRDIITGLHAIYAAVQALDLQLVFAIKDVNAGREYGPVPTLAEVPQFTPPTGKDDSAAALIAAWEIFEASLQGMIDFLELGSPWLDVVPGVLNSSQQIMGQVTVLFDDLCSD